MVPHESCCTCLRSEIRPCCYLLRWLCNERTHVEGYVIYFTFNILLLRLFCSIIISAERRLILEIGLPQSWSNRPVLCHPFVKSHLIISSSWTPTDTGPGTPLHKFMAASAISSEATRAIPHEWSYWYFELHAVWHKLNLSINRMQQKLRHLRLKNLRSSGYTHKLIFRRCKTSM